MLGVGEGGDEVVEADRRRDRDDVAARDRDLARGAVAEVEQVAQHLPLERAEVAALGRRGVGLVDRVLELVAQRRFMILAEDQGAHAAPQPRAAFVVVAASPSARRPR